MSLDINNELNELAPEISDLLKTSTNRYSTPEGYEAKLRIDLLSQAKTKAGKDSYQVPNAYFEQLKQQVLENKGGQVSPQKSKKAGIFRMPVLLAAAASIVLLIGFFGMYNADIEPIAEIEFNREEILAYVSNDLDDLTIDDFTEYDFRVEDVSWVEDDIMLDDDLMESYIQDFDDEEFYEFY